MKKTRTLQIRIDDDLYNAIAANADNMGLSVSSYVRFCLIKFLKVFK